MRRLLIVVGVLILAIVAVVGASGYWMKMLVTGPLKDRLLLEFNRRAGADVTVTQVDFDIPAWYRLRPVVTLEGFQVANPPGYSPGSLLAASRLRVEAALAPLLDRRIQVVAVEAVDPVLRVESNKQGDSNLEAFLKRITGGRTPSEGETTQWSMDRFTVRNGKLLQGGTTQLAAIDIEMAGFAPGQPAQVNFGAQPFGGKASHLRFQGETGPFVSRSLPVHGKVTGLLELSEVPSHLVRERFGKVLEQPSRNSKVTLESDLKGDLYETVAGQAKATFSGLMIGRDAGRRLPLEGSAPVGFRLRRLLATPVTELSVRNGSLRLGTGQWHGNVDLIAVGGVARGKSTGSIRGIEMDQFLTAFTESSGKVQGQLLVPTYTLRFSGRDTNQIRRSLNGTAAMEITNGRVRALDLLSSIQRALDRIQGDVTDRTGNTEFATLNTAIEVSGEKVRVNPIRMEGPLRASGEGTIGFDSALAFRLQTIVGRTPLSVTIDGTINNPRVRPDLTAFLKETVRKQLEQILKEKLVLPPMFRKQ